MRKIIVFLLIILSQPAICQIGGKWHLLTENDKQLLLGGYELGWRASATLNDTQSGNGSSAVQSPFFKGRTRGEYIDKLDGFYNNQKNRIISIEMAILYIGMTYGKSTKKELDNFLTWTRKAATETAKK
ncbi:hypothetical protein [Agarilytica rhodophyticola]|uniref:hypothetical protein n=1 Tax=Agarilytica rhodophyticola TaxID=1737490 RepID=UPI000B34472E|nr:hypothetical protein [Agarilytica rhodophyticola]